MNKEFKRIYKIQSKIIIKKLIKLKQILQRCMKNNFSFKKSRKKKLNSSQLNKKTKNANNFLRLMIYREKISY